MTIFLESSPNLACFLHRALLPYAAEDLQRSVVASPQHQADDYQWLGSYFLHKVFLPYAAEVFQSSVMMSPQHQAGDYQWQKIASLVLALPYPMEQLVFFDQLDL